MRFEVLEGDACRWRAVFKDEQESPLVPNTVHWRLDCASTRQTVRDWTVVGAQATYDDFGQLEEAYAVIEIPAGDNAIRSSCNTREVKRLLVATNRGTDYERKEQVTYEVVNLQGAP